VKVAPAKIDLDQIHIPDPVSMELCKLRVDLERLKSQIEAKGDKNNESL
jgi:hypothetical protein